MPRAKGKLLVAARVANRWSKLRPPESYPPLTWELAVAIAVQMVRDGHYRYAVGTLLAFDCLLRIGELTALRADDVADAGDAGMSGKYRHTTVAIRQAKTGRNQSTVVEREEVKALLRPLLANTKPRSLLFPGGTYGAAVASGMVVAGNHRASKDSAQRSRTRSRSHSAKRSARSRSHSAQHSAQSTRS